MGKKKVVADLIKVIAIIIGLSIIGTFFLLKEPKTSSDNKEMKSYTPPSPTYILNTYRKKFHKTYCPSVSQMNPENRQKFYGTREDAIKAGYSPCGNCKP